MSMSIPAKDKDLGVAVFRYARYLRYMLTVIEHKNESVEVINPLGETKVYSPVFDLAAAKQLLEQINALKTSDGISLYAFWQYQGYYIYPALQEWLFWHVCISLVRHSRVWNDLRGHEVVFDQPPYETASGLKGLFDIINRQRSAPERFLYNICAGFLRLISRPMASVIVYDDSLDGFRYRKLKSTLSDIVSYSRLEPLHSLADAIRIGRARNVLCLGSKAWRYSQPPSVDYASASFLHPYLNQDEFQGLIAAIHRRCSDRLAEIPAMEKALSSKPPKLVIGYDQIQEAIAFVVACKLRHIPVVTYQHGLFTEYHAGWIAPGIPREYCNIVADTLVVWGDYWRQILLKYSNKYDDAQIVVGAHLRNEISYDSWLPPAIVSRQEITILLPFEFLADNIAISAYIRRFLACGWRVWVKMRPAGAGDYDDRLAFDEDIRDNIHYIDTIGDKEIAQIDIVAFTQSTVAYEMMPYNKPIWYLDTEFRFFDVVSEGIAHNITHDVLDHVDEPGALESLLRPRYTQEHYKAVFSNQNLHHVLQRLIENSKVTT